MAYETSLISDSPSAIPNQSQPQMREERVIDPYQSDPRRLAKAQAAIVSRNEIGQPAINSEKSLGQVPPADPGKPVDAVTLSPQMAALARKEQAFRRREQEAKAKELALEADRAEIAELKALKAKLAADDYSGVEDLVKYDKYTQYLIEKSGTETPEQKTIKELAQKLDAVEKSQKDDVHKRFEAAVNERRKAVTELVETNADYSSIKELKLQEAVVKHILDTWENDGIDLAPEQAAKEVEQELQERAEKWSKLAKKPAETPVDTKTLPPLKPGIKTLTNDMSAPGEIKRVPKSFQNMSDSERYAEARRRAEEKLKLQGR